MRIKALIIAALGVVGATASADEPEALSSTDAWTLQQCIDYAVAHNIDLQQRRIAIEQSDVDIEAREGALFPSLSFATNQGVSWRPWSQHYFDVNNGTMTSTSSELNYNGTYGLSAQWTVWNGGRNQKNLQRSRLARNQADVNADATEITLKEQIAQVYVQILYQREAVEVNRQILESSRVQLNRAQEMYEVGTMSRADLAQMKAQLSQDEYNVTDALTMLDNFKLQLKQLLEIVGDTDINVAVPDVDDEAVLAMLPSKEEVYASAVTTRPEIRYNQLGIEVADMDINIARRGYYPSISLTAGINTSNASGIGEAFADQIKTNLSNSVGLTISVPIFDNRSNKTNVLKAQLDKETAELNLAAQKKQLWSDIEGFWLSARNAQQQYISASANVDAMQESYNLTGEQFEVGLKDVVDLTTAKNNLLQAQQQKLQSKYTAILNIALLRFYSGEPIAI